MAAKNWLKRLVRTPANLILSPRELAAQRAPRTRGLKPRSNVGKPDVAALSRAENKGPTKMWRTIEASQRGPVPSIRMPSVSINRAAQAAASIKDSIPLDWTPSKVGQKARVKISLRRMGSTLSNGSSKKSFRWMRRDRSLRSHDGTPVIINQPGTTTANTTEAAYRLEVPRNQQIEGILGCLSTANQVSSVIQAELMPLDKITLDRLNVGKMTANTTDTKLQIQQMKELGEFTAPGIVPVIMHGLERLSERSVAEAGVRHQRQYLKINLRFGHMDSHTRLRANSQSKKGPAGLNASYEQLLRKYRTAGKTEEVIRMDDKFPAAQDTSRWLEGASANMSPRSDAPLRHRVRSLASETPARTYNTGGAFNRKTKRKRANSIDTARVVYDPSSNAVTVPLEHQDTVVAATAPIFAKRSIFSDSLMPVVRRNKSASSGNAPSYSKTFSAMRSRSRTSKPVSSAQLPLRVNKSVSTAQPLLRPTEIANITHRIHAPAGPLRMSLRSSSATAANINTEAYKNTHKTKVMAGEKLTHKQRAAHKQPVATPIPHSLDGILEKTYEEVDQALVYDNTRFAKGLQTVTKVGPTLVKSFTRAGGNDLKSSKLLGLNAAKSHTTISGRYQKVFKPVKKTGDSVLNPETTTNAIDTKGTKRIRKIGSIVFRSRTTTSGTGTMGLKPVTKIDSSIFKSLTNARGRGSKQIRRDGPSVLKPRSIAKGSETNINKLHKKIGGIAPITTKPASTRKVKPNIKPNIKAHFPKVAIKKEEAFSPKKIPTAKKPEKQNDTKNLRDATARKKPTTSDAIVKLTQFGANAAASPKVVTPSAAYYIVTDLYPNRARMRPKRY